MFYRRQLTLCSASFALALLVVGVVPGGAAEKSPSRWEPEIQAFEAADRTNPPPKNAILFVGSSSLRMWKTLAADFKEYPVINRGFGGSHMEDSVLFADRIILPCRPRKILLYAGDNDLASGKSAERVLSDFKALLVKVHHQLPEAHIAFISIKPSPSRWHLAEQIRTANRLVRELTATDRRLSFVDVFTPMLDASGKPREELFIQDKLHLNEEGYKLWASVVRPHLAP